MQGQRPGLSKDIGPVPGYKPGTYDGPIDSMVVVAQNEAPRPLVSPVTVECPLAIILNLISVNQTGLVLEPKIQD